MVNRKGSYRRGSRALMKKHHRQRGKISLTKYLQEYKEGEQVIFQAEPAVQSGIYHLRFHGRHGTVKAKRGKCYEVETRDGGKLKTIIVHPVHLTKAK